MNELYVCVAPLRTYLEAVREHRCFRGGAERARALVQQDPEKLVSLVDDVIAASPGNRTPVSLRTSRVRVSAVVGLALEMSEPVIEGSPCSLEVDMPLRPVWLDADLVRLGQALTNLLLNALKWTPASGRILLKAARVGEAVEFILRHDRLELDAQEVRNESGPTAVDEVHGDSRSSRYGPLIARALVEMHGGTLGVAHVGAQTVFTMRLPVWSGQGTRTVG